VDQDEERPTELQEMEEIARGISIKNFREYYHDAVVTRSEIQTLFGLGYLSLERKARAEQQFFEVCRKALACARQIGFASDEFRALEKTFRAKYVTNFSVFCSVPDAWAIEQLFPIVPIHRLNETPTEKGILVDLTCDSDGVIDAFVDVRDVKEALELHGDAGAGKPYLLAICLLGAYQEIMGAYHNLFGSPAEVSVALKGRRLQVESLSSGDTVAALAEMAGYDAVRLRKGLTRLLRARARARGRRMALKRHERIWGQGPYLEGDADSFRTLD
jgi:arginine decarboxylase